MITGNKGEWSEVYVLLRLIADKILYAGTRDLKQNTSEFYPILMISRNENLNNIHYILNNDLVHIKTNQIEVTVDRSLFNDEADYLLNSIVNATGSSFSVLRTESFLRDTLMTDTLKAKSSNKSDVKLSLYDKKICSDIDLGFSIKSQLGGNSTLLNASFSTNAIFVVEGFTGGHNDIDRINNIETRQKKIRNRISEIKSMGGSLKLHSYERPIFENNLKLIDTKMPDIFAFMIYDYYTSDRTNVKDLVDNIEHYNPLDFDTRNNHTFYVYKLKKLLSEIALGMVPASTWNGIYDATGGHLVVTKKGEILCYHIYDRNNFENYLINQTYFDTPSTSKHNFGKLNIDNGQLYFKLNIQIRYK